MSGEREQMNVLTAISDWVQGKDLWFSDAVRRIFTQSSLSPQDEEAIRRNLYSHHGLLERNASEPDMQPFARVTEPPQGAAPRVILKEIHSLHHVNALVPDQSLYFALDGLTVIYGENGAGKSGYARVLKHACFARDKSDNVKTNVLLQGDHTPQATIEFERDGDQRAFRWRANAPSHDDLANVAVFDSHCARVFVDEANEVDYLPYGMDTFPRLGELFEQLSSRIKQDLDSLDTNFSNRASYDPATAAGQLVHGLSESTSIDRVQTLGELAENEQDRLNQLRALCQRAALEAPRVRAQELNNRKRRFDQLAASLQTIRTVLSPERRQELAQLARDHELAHQAAELAAQTAFGDEPLRGSGTEPWQLLFDAARRFSEQEAYPERPFPFIDDGALCVLCQQPLDSFSRDRLRRFDEFVRDAAAKRRDQALSALRVAIDTVAGLDAGPLQSNVTLLDELQTADSECAAIVTAVVSEAIRLRAEIVAPQPNWTEVVATGDLSNPLPRLASLSAQLAAEATELERAGEPDTLAQNQRDLRELEDRVRLKADLPAIEKCLRDRRRQAGLKRCRDALATGPITRFNTDLMSRLVTDELRNNLKEELRHYDAPFPEVTMQRLGQKGKTKHKMVVGQSDKPSGILSEGEQRLIAIAAFLAELKTAKSHSPIIFDDPVSSLDHRYRERVAERLVAESKVRQVIVLTHDIVLLLKLRDEAAEQKSPVWVQTITRTPLGPGVPSNELPWQASNTKDRIGFLRQMIAGFRKLQAQSPETYQIQVARFYGLLREAWERAVEEILFNNVIQRYRPGVETQRLKQVTIESGDYLLVERGMTRCSTYLPGHDEAAALALRVPAPQEVENDLEALAEFQRTLTNRAEQTKKTNAVLSKAPTATISRVRADPVIDSAPVTPEQTSERFV